MPAPTLIFCFPGADKRLATTFPGSRIVVFTDTPDQCRRVINTLDEHAVSQAWLLFESLTSLDENKPVKDHINLSGNNSLIGPVDVSKGPRFPDLSSVYEATNGIIVVLGHDPDLKHFKEAWSPVMAGVWEAIALKQRGYTLRAWLIADLDKWIIEHQQNTA